MYLRLLCIILIKIGTESYLLFQFLINEECDLVCTSKI